jgi:hypothetical protein
MWQRRMEDALTMTARLFEMLREHAEREG